MTKKDKKVHLKVVSDNTTNEDSILCGDVDISKPTSMLNLGFSYDEQINIMDKANDIYVKEQLKLNPALAKEWEELQKKKGSSKFKVVDTISQESLADPEKPDAIENKDKDKKTNDEILNMFKKHLTSTGLTKKTIKSHMDNLDFFVEYLNYYTDEDDDVEECSLIIEAAEFDIDDFLGDWFPRKALWASPSSVKSYIGSFNKFFSWLHSKELISSDDFDDIKLIIKENKNDWIEACYVDDGW